jgi:hypothetical protein
LPSLRWWKCKIENQDDGLVGFKKGEIVYAKNGENKFTLFDGKQWVTLPKTAVKKIKLLSRLNQNETAFVERYYQYKLTRASHSSTEGGPGMLGRQDAQEFCKSRIDEALAVRLEGDSGRA